jgi:hypothetical protein
MDLKIFPFTKVSRLTLLLAVLTLYSWLISCEKNITVDLPDSKQMLVVEGYIEDGKHPYIILTKSSGFFSPLDSASLLQLVVDSAIVTVSDGAMTDTLKFIIDPFNFPYVFYKAQIMVGEVGKTYNLTIVTNDGQTLTSTTSIAPPIALDSTWFKIQEGQDTLGFAWAHLTDPPAYGNCYRWFTMRATKDSYFIPPNGSVFEDRFINGQSFDFAYARGQVPNSTNEDDLNEEAGFFKVGDTIYVKFCTIDYANFVFWRSAETQSSTNGNPFASPSDLKSNIKGGFGCWGGYAVTYDTIYAKP